MFLYTQKSHVINGMKKARFLGVQMRNYCSDFKRNVYVFLYCYVT